ncbi:MAG: hypothetical protein GY866_09405 [Proteobacteria bacterium]|nr:hypothetical protein [Pseudomonadota bacterium]
MKKNTVVLISCLFAFAFVGCGGVSPTPGVPEDKWEAIEERLGGSGHFNSDGVEYMRTRSQKILIDSFQVKYVYEKRKGEQRAKTMTTKLIRWGNDVYKTLTNQLYDQFVVLLEKRGHSVVDVKDYMNHADYGMIFEGQKSFEDTKVDSYLNACDARTDMCFEWVTATAHGMKLKSGFTGVSVSGNKFDKMASELGVDVQISVQAHVTFGWSEGNVVVNEIKIDSSIGRIEAREVWGKVRYFRGHEGIAGAWTGNIVGSKYADFPGLWDRLFKDKEVSADHGKFIESTMGAFTQVFDAYSILVAKKY